MNLFCDGVKNNNDVLLGATRTLVEYIRSFNMEYAKEIKLKKELNGKVFKNIDNSLTSVHDSLSKFDVPLTTWISP